MIDEKLQTAADAEFAQWLDGYMTDWTRELRAELEAEPETAPEADRDRVGADKPAQE